MPELNDDILLTGALGANARLFGAESAGASEPSSYGRDAIINTAKAGLATVATSGSASDLSSGTLPLGRLHGRVADFAQIATYAQGQLFYFNGANIVALSPGAAGQILETQGSGANPRWVDNPLLFLGAAEFVLDAGGITLNADMTTFIEAPYGGTIVRATMLADRTGSVIVDVRRCSEAAFDGVTHPGSGDSIVASSFPTIAGGIKYQDTTLAGWTTSVSAGDILAVSVLSAQYITRVTVSLVLERQLV